MGKFMVSCFKHAISRGGEFYNVRDRVRGTPKLLKTHKVALNSLISCILEENPLKFLISNRFFGESNFSGHFIRKQYAFSRGKAQNYSIEIISWSIKGPYKFLKLYQFTRARTL